jgi:DNA repair exonuclease SbcCD ATPase subunit
VPTKAAIGGMVKSADLAQLARSFQTLKQRLAEAEAELKREKQERESDADTIADMLVRIVALERGIREAAAAGARARDSRPPVVDIQALHRVAALEGRTEEAEARARNAEARAADADARAHAESERRETLARDHEVLRAKLADAEVRARSEQDRAAHADEVARAARARAIELAERIEPGTDRGDMRAERERHQRELEALRERNAEALRSAHDAYADAFRATLEDDRERARVEIEQQRAENRAATTRIAELEDQLRGIESRHETALAQVRGELAQLAFDRDEADRQKRLAELQLDAAHAKLELVDKQLEWAEESVALVQDALVQEASGELGSAVGTLIDRLASARGALFTEDDDGEEPRRSTRPPEGELPSDADDDGRTRAGKTKRRAR